MVIGTPLETRRQEHRVGLTPFGVAYLTQVGHTVLIQKDAGRSAHFADQDYVQAGAQIVYDAEEIYRRSEIVARVGMLGGEEIPLLRPGAVVCAFHHLAVAPASHLEQLSDIGATLVGYEVIRDAGGDLPVLTPLSEIAGQMAVHEAAHLLQNEVGGRGVLLGAVPGIPPATVLILGAGTVGRAAAREAAACGAHVILLDADLRKLRAATHGHPGKFVTVVAAMERLERYTAIADAVIGAVLIPGSRAPFVVTEEMVRAMKPGSVILDVSIDQGGCIATSRPTTLESPTFVMHDVLHYCVPNMTANLARTASRALATASVPFLSAMAEQSVGGAIARDPGLAAGVYLYRGHVVHRSIADGSGLPVRELADLLAEEG